MKSMNTGEVYAAGHSIWRGEGEGRQELASGVTFVDQANAADDVQDGTAEHPFGVIGQAVAAAGENRVIFVAAGEYREYVELASGQTLCGEIPLSDGTVWAASAVPLIAPPESDDSGDDDKDAEKPQPTLIVQEACILRCLRVEAACHQYPIGIAVPAHHQDNDDSWIGSRPPTRVERCEIRAVGEGYVTSGVGKGGNCFWYELGGSFWCGRMK